MSVDVTLSKRETVQSRLKRINFKVLGTALFTIAVIVISSVLVSLTYSMLEAHRVRSLGLAEYLSPALLFDDRPAISKSLSGLRDSPAVAAAIIVNTAGEVLGSYQKKDSEHLSPDDSPSTGTRLSFNALLLVTPVVFEGKELAKLHMKVRLEPVVRQTAVLGLTIILASALAMAAVYLMLQRLQGALVYPLQRLIAVIDSVGANPRYAGRAPGSDIAELDTLSERFNDMLAMLEQRDLRLAAHREDLEAEVARRTAELVTAKNTAESANRAKSEFLATMSHEIRTPLNGVYGLTELLVSSGLSVAQRRYADTLKQSCDHLLAVVKDVLDFSKVESGSLRLEALPLNLHQLLRNSSEMMAATALQQSLQLITEIDPASPQFVVGDPVRIRQIVFNLLSNALKFTSAGQVKLALGKGPGGEVVLSVSDTGIGIAENAQQRIFESFTQADGSTTRRFGGSGLGLAICKQLTELMGGRIELESAPDEGATFTVTLPLPGCAPERIGLDPTHNEHARDPKLEADTARLPQLCGRVLLAEDNPVNRTVAEAMLGALGLGVYSTNDGAEALDALSKQSFDLVLMDCQMPVMDGYETLTAIRKLPDARAKLPVIALTANELRIDNAFDGHLGKPYTRSALGKLLGHWLPNKPRSADLSSHPAVGASSLPMINRATVANILALDPGGRSGLFKRLQATFSKSSKDLLAQVQAAISANNAQAIERAAHALKSASGSVGAEAMAANCKLLEQQAAQGILDQAQSLYQQLVYQSELVQSALAESA